jgi:hypothetical protein
VAAADLAADPHRPDSPAVGGEDAPLHEVAAAIVIIGGVIVRIIIVVIVVAVRAIKAVAQANAKAESAPVVMMTESTVEIAATEAITRVSIGR